MFAHVACEASFRAVDRCTEWRRPATQGVDDGAQRRERARRRLPYMLEAQLTKGKRQIDERTVDRFGDMLRDKLRGEDSSLRSAYLRMFVAEVRVGPSEIIISGPLSALENGLAVGLPVKEGAVPIFDREWCRLQDSNL